MRVLKRRVPAMQKDEALAVGRVEQVVEPVLRATPVVACARNLHGIPDGEDQLAFSAVQIHAPDA